VLRLRQGSQPVLKKTNELLWLTKKSLQQLSDENRHGRHHAHSTAKPFAKWNVNRPDRAQGQQAIQCRKEGKFDTIVDKSLDIHRMICE